MPGFTFKPLGPLVAACLLIGCSDDNGNGPIDNTTRFDQIADALTGAEHDFLTSNAGITASLEYFSPFIAAKLGFGGLAKSDQQSCLPVDVSGKILKFNGTAYVVDIDTVLAQPSARFILYRMSQSGTPILSEPTGHIQFTCEAGLAADVQVVSEDVLIASVAYSEQSGLVTGGIRSSDGTKDMLIDGGLSIEGDLELNFLLEDDDMQATYEFPLSGSGTRIAHAAIIGPNPEPDWGYFADVTVNSSDNVTSGAAHFRIEPDILGKVAACIGSGTLSSPVFTSPTSSCPPTEVERLDVTAAQLQDMSDAYHSLYELWTGVSGLVRVNLALLALGS